MKKITIILTAIVTFCNAQTKVSLDEAINIALKNNYILKSEKLKSDYQKQLIKTAKTIAPTSFSTEFGQVNSFYNDTKFGISQTINFPTVYSNQKKVLTEEWKNAVLNVTLKEAELKKAVTEGYYALVYLNEKEKLLEKSDSIYSEFFKKAELRFKKGESNILEKTTAQTQSENIKMQIVQLLQEQETAQIEFRLLLNDEQTFEPNSKLKKIQFIDENSVKLIENHPNLKILEQQKNVYSAYTKLEKSRLLPNFTIGYTNNSFIGTGPNDVVYEKSTRFQSAQFGLEIPLFGGSQKARIEAAKIAENIVENDYINKKRAMQNHFNALVNQYQSSLGKLLYFEKTALPNAKIIDETANKQFYNGNIDFLDWSLLINQSVNIRSNYIETLAVYNQTIIDLNYLISK